MPRNLDGKTGRVIRRHSRSILRQQRIAPILQGQHSSRHPGAVGLRSNCRQLPDGSVRWSTKRRSRVYGRRQKPFSCDRVGEPASPPSPIGVPCFRRALNRLRFLSRNPSVRWPRGQRGLLEVVIRLCPCSTLGTNETYRDSTLGSAPLQWEWALSWPRSKVRVSKSTPNRRCTQLRGSARTCLLLA